MTAISAFVLGLYQLSKDKRRVDFRIIFSDSPPPKGWGNIMIVNTGYLPVYFDNARYLSEENKKRILVYSDTKKMNVFKKFLNNINRKWFSPFKKQLSVEDFIIQDNKTDENHNSHSIVINSGNSLQYNFNSWDYKDFFKIGNNFFITDGIGNIFYMRQESLNAIKKVLEKYEKDQPNKKTR